MTVKDRILDKLFESDEATVKKAVAALKAAGFPGKAARMGIGIRITFPSLGRGNFIDVKNGTAFIKGNKGSTMKKALDGIMPSKVIMG